jgi:predicted nucleic acid-binding protein
MPGSFFDTNVLLYLVSTDHRKADRAEELVRGGGTISVQVLNEITKVARRKADMSWPETHGLLEAIRGLLNTEPLTLDVHDTGLALAERYNLSTYDAMIAASALEADCDLLWSEDMQHGLVLRDRLLVSNPFT